MAVRSRTRSEEGDINGILAEEGSELRRANKDLRVLETRETFR